MKGPFLAAIVFATMMILLIPIDGEAADAENFHLINMRALDGGRGFDYHSPVSINEHFSINIQIQSFYNRSLNITEIHLYPILNGYSKIVTSDNGDLPEYNPYDAINDTRAMGNLYEITSLTPIGTYVIFQNETISLNYSLMLRTAGTWSLLIAIHTSDGGSQILIGSTLFVARNLPSYLSILALGTPFATAGAYCYMIILNNRRQKLVR
jgi:hypothetical protein